MKTLIKLLFTTFLLIAVVFAGLIAIGVVKLQEVLLWKDMLMENGREKTVTLIDVSETTQSTQTLNPQDVPNNPETQITHKIRGMVKKEVIPEELQLGDYWYWIYLDAPLIIENNAYGKPIEVNKIQLTVLSDSNIDLEKYLDDKVEISGNITWGYAESNVFRCVSIVYTN